MQGLAAQDSAFTLTAGDNRHDFRIAAGRRSGMKVAQPDPASAELQQARAGDLRAFAQLVRRHQPQVFGLALHLAGNPAHAMELAQDALARLHMAVARIRSPAHLQHWLLRETVQLARDRGWQARDVQASDASAVDPGEEFTARVIARIELRASHRRAAAPYGRSGRRLRSSLLLAGVALFALAVSVMMWWPRETAPPPVVAATTAPTQATAAAATSTARVQAAAPTAALRTPRMPDPFPHYTVILLPARHSSPDPDAAGPVEAFHAALLAELRQDPALTLLVPGVTAPPDPRQPADFVLLVASLETRTLASGSTAFLLDESRGGSLNAGRPAAARQWPVEIRVSPLRDPSIPSFSSTLQLGENLALLPQLAAREAGMLRTRMFPDAILRQQLLARFRDVSLPAAERGRAMQELLEPRRAGAAVLADAELWSVTSAVATLPARQRAQLWRSLRGVPHADLVAPLIDALRDADLAARYEALATLAADYRNQPQATAAIEAVSRQDADRVMRIAAQRALAGEAEWQSRVLDSLRDATLPATDRLAPLVLAGRSATTPAETLAMDNLVGSGQTGELLMNVVRDSWFDYTQVESIASALALLAGDRHATDSRLLVELPAEAAQAAIAAAPVPAGQVTPASRPKPMMRSPYPAPPRPMPRRPDR